MDDTDSFPWWRKDATIIAVLVALAAVAFTVTYFYTRSYEKRQQALAQRWFSRGEASLQQGRPREAIINFRTAMLYEPDGPDYRHRLAEALAANGDTPQAIAYFLNLWEEQPGNGLYNLELARLYSRTGDNRRATRFYNGAIYGAWDENPAENRRQSRLEYISFLMSNNSITQAQAEAITLAAGVPPTDIPARFTAADVLVKTGEYDRALDEYESLMENDAARAALGAGHAAFQLGQFRSATRYFQQAIAKGNQNPAIGNELQLAKLVLDSNPSQHRISDSQREKRTLNAYAVAGARLQQCAISKNQQLEGVIPTTDLQKLYDEWAAMGPDTDLKKLADDSDGRDQIMDLVSRIEQTTSRDCGPPTGADWALLMLSRFGEGVER